MDYQTCALRNMAYLFANFPKRQTLRYRRHTLKAMYLLEKVEYMLDYFLEVYYAITSEEFENASSLMFIRMVEDASHRILKVSRMLYSNDKETLSFFNSLQVKFMIEGFCYVVESVLIRKYHASIKLNFI
jgi:hypothetical protein